MNKGLGLAILLLASSIIPSIPIYGESITGGELPLTKIKSVGNIAYIIDGVTPKGGHDAFSYDGSGHKRITGSIQVDLDPIANTGIITAEWTDLEGNEWTYKQTQFAGGNEMYIGETVDGVTQTTLDLDPVAINHFEHGTTGAGPPIEPTLFVYLASWGPAEVFKNGESQGTFETHMMITDGARDVTSGKIFQSDGTTPYSPMFPENSLVNHNTAQIHLVYHTAPAPEMTNTFPPPFEVFEHTMFYDIDILPNASAEIHMQDTDDAEGGGCLIATAAYGSELAPQVQFLREIRDNTVMSTSTGAAFMTGFNQLYYSFSPQIADLERKNPMFQEAVRVFITPMMSTLSIMTLAEDGNDAEILGLGISVIALNLGMYIAVPAAVGFTIHRKIKSRK